MSEKIKCPGCGAEFNSKTELTDHVVERHDITCQMCGAKLNTKDELIHHNKEKHGF